MRLAVLGASGRLGRRILACAHEEQISVVAAVAHQGSASLGRDAGELAGIGPSGLLLTPVGPGCFAEADVVIDVSLPEGTEEALPWLGAAALVTGVTGRSPSQDDAVREEASRRIVVTAANFSAGVHVLASLTARAASALPDYDIEVVELHHRRKVDAPSGTARLLVDAAAQARGQDGEAISRHGRQGRTGQRPGPRAEIGVHALRLGDVVGEHEVWVAGEGERLRLGHVATSRDAFARGALRAARWAVGRAPGAYTMRDVLGLAV